MPAKRQRSPKAQPVTKSPSAARSSKASSGKASSTKASSAKASSARASSGRAANAKAAAAADRLGQLEHLIELMVQKDVVEVELEESGARWRVRRTEPQTVTYAAPPMAAVPAQMAMPAPMGMPHVGMQPGGLSAGAAGAAAGAEPEGEVFKSPMLGTFYRAASPDAESFCKPGDRVTADRTLCIIEAMKVMNEIKAEREFEIVDVLVKNGEPVEYGQPLFLIR